MVNTKGTRTHKIPHNMHPLLPCHSKYLNTSVNLDNLTQGNPHVTEMETLKGMVNDTTAHAQKCDIRVTIIIVFGWIFCCTSGETQKINYLSKNIPFL